MKSIFTPSILRTLLLAFLFVAIIVSQIGYDAAKVTLPAGLPQSVSPEFVRLVDMGFHSTAGSFLWISTMPEILGIYFSGSTQYLTDLSFVNAVDPRLSYPYAFTVLILPELVHFPNHDAIAVAVGKLGIANADPDWRIPYYLGAEYYLNLKDEKDALIYYDIAANTPGIPAIPKNFALNFSALPDDRAKTEALWESIAETTTDANVKQRAEDYIYRLQIFDYLEAAAKAYKIKNGKFPATLQALVTAGVIPSIPQDPFGYQFKINPDGTVELDLSKIPAGD